ncbi:MAG: class I SAM-dependent methyltransferase, partial [Candidatus Margulisiibacteriota bacterium]
MIRANPAKYENWFNSLIGRYAEASEKRLIAKHLKINYGDRILDIGCGTGRFTSNFIGQGAEVHGLDSSWEMVRFAEDKYPGIEFKVGEAESICWPDNYFNVVVAITALEFISDPQKALFEMKRVLKPGGSILIGALNRGHPWAAYRKLRGFLGHPIWSKARFFTRAEMKRLLNKAGITDIVCESALFGAFILFKGGSRYV